MSLVLAHCTSVERGRLIAAEGLKPGDETRCNYDDGRWLPLPGVYFSQSPAQIENYRRAHGLADCAIVMVAADPDDLLPDEDLIELFMGRAHRTAAGLPQDERLDEEYEAPPSGDALWSEVGREFLRQADPGRTGALSAELLDELVDCWAQHEFREGVDIHPLEWIEMKDAVVRALPRMEGLALAERSKRHVGPIGFEGSTRIVAVVELVDGDVSVVHDAGDEEAMRLALIHCQPLPSWMQLGRREDASDADA